MNAVMYIFVNKGLGMSPGKIAAQASHAAVEAFRISDERMIEKWYRGGHHTKLVMQAEDSENLKHIREYIEARGFKTHLVIDEGRTEITPFTPTALGVEIVDKDRENVQAVFGEFRTFKPDPPADASNKPSRFGWLYRSPS